MSIEPCLERIVLPKMKIHDLANLILSSVEHKDILRNVCNQTVSVELHKLV